MSSEVAIKVTSLSKAYHIYEKPHERFLQMLFRGAKQYYREFWALKNISLEVKRGETVGIIGKNGSGKSTLLQIICGTLPETGGSTFHQGKIAALLELGSGFNPEFTGRENVVLSASILGLSNDEIQQKFDEIVTFADIGEFLDQPVKTYSSGMLVRLAFAVIAHVDADILVIDEALAVGDAFFTQKCMRFLRRFCENGTLLFVSHDTSSVVALCDRAIWIEEGEVRASGPAKDVTSLYLEGLYDSDPDKKAQEKNEQVRKIQVDTLEYKDQRMNFINNSNLRNDIELFEFDDKSSAFGNDRAAIVGVDFLAKGKKLTWAVGGEDVSLSIHCTSKAELKGLIVGFFVKDRLGQRLFGDNTYLTYRDSAISVNSDTQITACFEFTMPILPVGDYSIDVAVAEGNQEQHEMLHWAYDVLVFRAQSSMICHGLIGVPMKSIAMNVHH